MLEPFFQMSSAIAQNISVSQNQKATEFYLPIPNFFAYRAP